MLLTMLPCMSMHAHMVLVCRVPPLHLFPAQWVKVCRELVSYKTSDPVFAALWGICSSPSGTHWYTCTLH